jgi:Flp pilus assembly pilin Flp
MRLVERAQLKVGTVRSQMDAVLSRVAARSAGQSTVEYALVGALVVIAAAGAMTLLGDQVSSVFGHITTTLSGAPAGH